jgi:hypothetical protein
MKKPEKKPSTAHKGKPAAPVNPDQHKAFVPIAAQAKDSMAQVPKTLSDNGSIRGRPATGKRSNPEWKLYSHFLQKKTQRAAVAKLQAEDDGRDLSDVLQELLEDWIRV